MNRMKSHPFEREVDRFIQDLGGDLATMKQVTDSGVMYRASFGGIPLYVALPTYVPNQNENLLRIEFTIGSVPATEVPRFLFAVSLDLDMNRHCLLRLVTRTKDHQAYDMTLQTVANVDLVQNGFVASTTLYGAELAQYYRDEFLIQSEAA